VLQKEELKIMSFAYNTNTAYDYRRYDDREQAEEYARPARRPADRAVLMARRVLLLSVAVLVAVICIAMVYVKAQVFMMQREVNQTQQDIKAARQINSSLNEQYNEATNINTIMERASGLGMGYPSGDQMLVVSMEGQKAGVEMKNK
jgi:cell division protein FtsL